MAVGHLKGVGVGEVQLNLPPSPFTLRPFHRDTSGLHMVSQWSQDRFLTCALKDVVILQVPGYPPDAAVSLRIRLGITVSEHVALEFGGNFETNT